MEFRAILIWVAAKNLNSVTIIRVHSKDPADAN